MTEMVFTVIPGTYTYEVNPSSKIAPLLRPITCKRDRTHG